MRWIMCALSLAVLLTVVALPASADDCSYFYKNNATCVQGGFIKIIWMENINATCDLVSLTLQRKCGNGPWNDIGYEPSDPYLDPVAPLGCGAGFTYRLKRTCVCNNNLVDNYSSEMGPVHCP